MAFAVRLQLLQESGQVSPAVAELTLEYVKKIEDRFEVQLTEENGAMLVTHLAMALERLQKGEPVGELPPEALAELKAQTEAWAFMSQLAQEVEARLGVTVPEAEIGFLTAHLGALLS